VIGEQVRPVGEMLARAEADLEMERPRIEKIDLKDVINKGVPDVELEPFDVVYVPMSGIAKVDKFVDQYIRQLLPISLNAGFQYILGDYRQVVPVVPPQ